MVEIREGEVIFRREELGVTLLVDIEQLGAVEVRAARGWGKSPLHVHARHAETLFVFEGELALTLEDRVHRVGPETWAFVPPEVVHAFEVTSGVGSTEPPESGGAGFAGAGAGSDEHARFLVLHTPCSGFGDYVRGSAASFDQRPPPEYATGDPNLVLVRRGGGKEGETMAGRTDDRRATLLVDADELTVTEFFYGPGQRGAQPHVHHHHADAFLVVEGELTVLVGTGAVQAPAGTLIVLPPDVAHGFDNESSESALFYNFHMPASGFADYMRGRNPDFDQHDPPADGGADPATAIAVRLPDQAARRTVLAELDEIAIARARWDPHDAASRPLADERARCVYVLEGRVAFAVEGSPGSELGTRTLIYVPAGVAHTFAAAGGEAHVLELWMPGAAGEVVVRAAAGRETVEVLQAPRGVPHTFSNPSESPLRLLNLFVPGGYEQFFRDRAAGIAAPAELTARYDWERA